MTDISNLDGITGLVSDEDIQWGTGEATDIFSLTTYSGSTLTGTKIPSLKTTMASKIKGVWYASSSATIADHGNVATVGSIAYVANLIGTTDNVKLVLPPGDYPVLTNLTVAANITLAPMPGVDLQVASGKVLTINGPFEAGPWQAFSGTGSVVFGSGSVNEVLPEWWETSTSDTSALGKAVTACGTTKTLKLGARTYNVTSTSGGFGLTTQCSISGESPYNSIIHNTGTGSALLLFGSPYYSKWKDFSVTGTASSEDGIVTSDNTTSDAVAYGEFDSVISSGHGRHGLVHRLAWATRYFNCRFQYNGGLGVYLYSPSGDAGYGPAQFFGCDSRHNGGSGDASTDYSKGGVNVAAATNFLWLGGAVENNNAWGFILSGQTTNDVYISTIQNVTFENIPTIASSSTTGGLIRVTGDWYNVSVRDCTLAYGAKTGATGYGVYASADVRNGLLDLRNNVLSDTSTGGTGIDIYTSGNVFKNGVPDDYFTEFIGGSAWSSGLALFKSVNSSVFFDLSAPANQAAIAFRFKTPTTTKGRIQYGIANNEITFMTNGADNTQITAGGDFKNLLAGKGIVMTNAAGTVTKRVRLDDAGTGLIFENE